MNRRLQQPRLDNRFVAMAFGVYDASTKTLVVANAGFPRPHLLRNGRVQEIPVQGLPLGIMPEPHYDERTVKLEVGDVVLFCSDGLTECFDIRGEEFGLERVEAFVIDNASATAQEIADGLLRVTEAHAGGSHGEPQDDRTVVVLKVLAD